ncbi:spin [Symbiodinium natans]|uniref:Spin protein n=1 Tax=Symbiodinium natans TaxID=878477 RepID=A0A812HR79_9DINO|nr:spin [Symbiodinium natans]
MECCRLLRPPVIGTAGERQPGSRRALFTLSCINALNFADRYVPASVKPQIQKELELNDWESALPAVAMTGVFTVCSLVFGILADRECLDRRLLLAGGIAFWSFATALGGFAQDLTHLVLFRALVGVGEAAFATVASPMITDFYPGPQRNRAFTIFSLSAPVGAALGFGIGSVLGEKMGWRVAFFACGFPGVVVAFTVLLLNDPVRGINDDLEDPLHEEAEDSTDEDSDESTASASIAPCVDFLREGAALLSNPFFLYCTLGSVAISFAVGGLTEWYPTFLVRYTDLSMGTSGLVLSGSCVISGFGGTILGSKVADSVARRYPALGSKAYFLVPACFMVPGTVLIAAGVNVLEPWVLVLSLVLGQTFFFCYQAPIAALSMSVIPVHSRARGSSLQILLGHALGDVISPPIIGHISDVANLQLGLQVTWVAVLFAGVSWFTGYACLAKPPMLVVPRQAKDSGTIRWVLKRGMSSLCPCECESSEECSDEPT